MLKKRGCSILFVVLCVFPFTFASAGLELQANDRIVFLGNTFAERLRHFGYFETGLLLRFPDRGLTFRNLGWSADEVALRPRPLNFGDIHVHLTDQQADVVFLCFGFSESFQGKEGLFDFQKSYQRLIDELRGHAYNGMAAPRLVLISPFPQEGLGALPDFTERNAELALYVDAIGGLAQENELAFIDLFDGVSELYGNEKADHFTFNGIHLEAYGAWVFGQRMLEKFGVLRDPLRVHIDAQSGKTETNVGDVVLTRADGSSIHFRISRFTPAYPPPPQGSRIHPDLVPLLPALRVTHLSPGKYALKSGTHVLAEADHLGWATGVAIERGFQGHFAEAIRKRVVYKNQLFFDRWRAVNGFYIYGGRKEPFGVKNFPAEMQRFDELTRQEETAILAELGKPQSNSFELVRTGN